MDPTTSPRNPERNRPPWPPWMHRPKPVVQPVTLRLDRVIVRVDRLLRNRLILPRLVIPLTPKPPHQSLPPRIHRDPRRPVPRIPQKHPQPLHPVLQQHPVPPQPPPPSSRRPRPGPSSNQLAPPRPSHPWQPSLTKCSLPPPVPLTPLPLPTPSHLTTSVLRVYTIRVNPTTPPKCPLPYPSRPSSPPSSVCSAPSVVPAFFASPGGEAAPVPSSPSGSGVPAGMRRRGPSSSLYARLPDATPTSPHPSRWIPPNSPHHPPMPSPAHGHPFTPTTRAHNPHRPPKNPPNLAPAGREHP